MEFDFVNKTLVCKFNSYIVKSNNSELKVTPINIKHSNDHLLLHQEVDYKSYVTSVFKNPKTILKEENYKENLKTYVSIVSKGKTTFKKSTNPILNLLKFKKKYWKELLSRDVHGFIYLSKVLNFNAYQRYKLYDKQYEIISMRNTINESINDREMLSKLIENNQKLALPILSHVDFCVGNASVDPMVEHDREYKRMLDYILFDQKFKIEPIRIKSPFFEEVGIFNRFLKDEEQVIVDKRFRTLNERGVRDFIKDTRDGFINFQ
ncbi:hypothetical protein NGRA_1721 [Nosema granulosis]|uniref:Uncharacterized protein n=1 Tax=Nosema granulosis TaxID=83296 RepID=A0A9P6GY06_9MICR|nr:hypothetical protein NGRA_1721 [Nosema granulosis]